jgi:pimeloyl-ACP methyl ester carboxylesterase
MRPLKVIGACAAGASALAYAAYRKDLEAARTRIETGRQFIDSPHGPIEFGEAGDGPAVLLVHGAGGGFDQGLDLGADFLGEGYRIIAPSRFGYLGTPLPDDASPEAQADAHLRLLDALQLETVPVVGVSAGGPSVMQLALRYPERCSALVLVVPMPWASPQERMNALPPHAERDSVVGLSLLDGDESRSARTREEHPRHTGGGL